MQRDGRQLLSHLNHLTHRLAGLLRLDGAPAMPEHAVPLASRSSSIGAVHPAASVSIPDRWRFAWVSSARTRTTTWAFVHGIVSQTCLLGGARPALGNASGVHGDSHDGVPQLGSGCAVQAPSPIPFGTSRMRWSSVW